MKLSLLLVPGFVLAASVASAQAPFPGAVQVNGGWVPCDHPVAIAVGKGCVTTPGTIAPDPAATASLPTAVTALPRSDMGTRFELGKTYESPYGFRVTIIGTVRKTDGLFVFVAEVVKSGGAPAKGEILQLPVNEDRGAFQFEVPVDQLAALTSVIR